MSNRIIEAVLRVSSKLGSMQAFSTLGGKLAQVDRQAKAFNRSQMLVARGASEMSAALMRYAAPAAIAAFGVSSTKAFATIERRMERIGITADASAKQTAAALDTVRQVANDLGAPVENVIEGLENLVSSGKSLDEALAFLPSVAGTAHAADAAFGDMATTADAIGSSFKITAGEMDRAFDILAKGGKAGKFELKDMAAELPSLAPAFAALGYKGEEGLKKLTAALQTVRLETGTSSEAATSFMDVLTKMESETMKNNFKRFGIDIRKEMARARREGRDTLDTFIDLSSKAVKGDLSKLPQLFTDKQMLIGMRALINNTATMSGYMRDLGNATGTVRNDVARLGDDAQATFDKMGNSWRQLKESIGEGLVVSGKEIFGRVSDNMSREAAENRFFAINGMGLGDVARYKLGAMTGKGPSMASAQWAGGYRSESEAKQIAAYRDYANGRGAAADPVVTPSLPKDRFGLPVSGPIPSARGGGDAAFDAEYARQKAARPYYPGTPMRFAAGATPRDAERDSMAALRSDPNGIADAINDALARGGERAGSTIEDAGMKAGENAGSTFRQIIEGAARSFGEIAASTFNRNARAPRSAPAVSGDLGIVSTP